MKNKLKNHLWIIGGLVLLGLWSFLPRNPETDIFSIETENEVAIEPQEAEKIYGFEVDSFLVTKGKIKKGEFLADILLRHHIPYPEIDKAVKTAKPVFDVRYIAVEHDYTILAAKDSTEKAHYFVYEITPVEYVVFDLRDTMHVYRDKKPVELVEKTVEGTITSSLYQALVDNDATAGLAMELAAVYAWTIDFYRIQKGDRFKVIYQEQTVEGKTVGVGQVQAAVFTHREQDIYAFLFDQDGKLDYFDEQGQGLRKAFLKAPLKFSRISSRFSKKRFHPVQKRWKSHLGTDYAAPTGTPILAVGDGTVTEAKFKKFNGNYVKIKHNGTYSTQYLHMSKIGKGMKPGKRVRQGDVIGYVGSTGLATGPHVCFRFWKNGKQVDHLKENFPASEPVKESNKAKYEEHIEALKKRLDAIGEPAATDHESEIVS